MGTWISANSASFSIARIGHDELGPVHHCVLQECSGHWVGLGHVGADDKEGLGLGKVRKRIGHCSGTERSRQPGDGRSVSGTGAVINVIGLEHRAEKFLHLIGIFIDTPGAADAGQGVRAMLGNGLFHFARHQVQGFVPGGLP